MSCSCFFRFRCVAALHVQLAMTEWFRYVLSFLVEVAGVMAKHWASEPGMVSLLTSASMTSY